MLLSWQAAIETLASVKTMCQHGMKTTSDRDMCLLRVHMCVHTTQARVRVETTLCAQAQRILHCLCMVVCQIVSFSQGSAPEMSSVVHSD